MTVPPDISVRVHLFTDEEFLAYAAMKDALRRIRDGEVENPAELAAEVMEAVEQAEHTEGDG